jgi:hypothetical protein
MILQLRGLEKDGIVKRIIPTCSELSNWAINDTLVSPKILPGNKGLFQIFAPKVKI